MTETILPNKDIGALDYNGFGDEKNLAILEKLKNSTYEFDKNYWCYSHPY